MSVISKLKHKAKKYQQEQFPLWKFQLSDESAKWKKLKNKYYGERCFILGNGPSLKQQDLTVLKDEITFVSNWFPLHENYEQINPNYYCICAHEIFGGWNKNVKFDSKLYQLLQKKAQNTIKVFPFFFKEAIEKQQLFDKNEVFYLFYEPPVQEVHQAGQMNLDITSQRMHMGHTVINIFCLPIAYYLGFKEIYLLGCDCDYGMQKSEDSRSYFYDSAQHTSEAPDFEWLRKSWEANGPMIQAYVIAKKEFESKGRKIYNATAGGKLEVFPRVKLEDII